jgi:hypothetical protein
MAKVNAAKAEEAKRKKEIAASGGNEYMGALRENDNKAAEISASGLDEAIGALELASGGGGGAAGGGKKVNLKAAYAAYEEVELGRLKVEQPGLKLSQYKERIFKAWQTSPENPANQAGAVELS